MKSLRPLRVVMMMENSRYPADVRVRQEAETLVAEGHRVWAICPASPGQKARETTDGVHVLRYPAPPDGSGLVGYLWEYGYAMAATFAISLTLLFRDGFDVIHSANPPDTFVFIAALYKLLGKRFMYDHHDLAPEMYWARSRGKGSRIVRRVLLLLEQLSCRLADHVIAANESYKSVEMERGRVPSHRITVVRNGPRPDRLKPVEPALGVRPPGKIVIGYAGVMGVQDGVDYLLRALKHLIHDFGRSDAFGLLIGRGEALPSLKLEAERLGLGEHVCFTGWLGQTAYPHYLSAVDICAAPEPSNSYNDRSTVIKIMEYMAVGKPVVAFDLPEHRFTAQEAAIYVKPNDELEFARALAQLMDDPLRREVMAAYGRRRIEMELAWDHSAEQLVRAYKSLYSEQPGDITETASGIPDQSQPGTGRSRDVTRE